MRLGDLAPRRASLDLVRGPPGEGRGPREDLAEDRTQGEDVGALVQGLDLAARLLGRHVGRGPHHAPRPRGVVAVPAPPSGHRRLVRLDVDGRPVLVLGCIGPQQDLGQAPVHDLDLAEAAHHDVRRLQVAVDDPPAWA